MAQLYGSISRVLAIFAALFLVATDAPWFVGEESLQLARDWYAKEFGITFVEITRPVTVHVVRRKQ